MRRIFFFVAVALFAQCFCISLVSAADEDIKNIRVGVYDNYPKIYKDKDGSIKGFWADITNYIARKENWNLTYDYGTWDEELAKLDKGNIDLMVDVAVSEERKQKYDFNNETALNSWGILYERKGISINSFQDITGKKIAVLKSGILYTGTFGLEDVFASFNIRPGDIIDVKEYGDVFKLLDNGEADVGAVNWFFGIANESKYKVDRTGIIFQPSELRYALPKGGPKNDYLISVLDFHIKELKGDQNSIYFGSIKTHFGEYLEKVEVLPGWWNIALITAGVIVIILLAVFLIMRQYQKTLRKEINERISEIKESEEKYSAVVNQAQDGIIIVQDGVCKYANKAVEVIGYSEKELIGRSFVDFIAPEEKKKVSEIYKRRVEGQKVVPVYETKIVHKNGSLVDVEFSSGIIRYGKKPADLVIVRDITDRKKMEREARLRSTILETELEVAIDGVLIVDGKGNIILYNQRFVDMWEVPKETVESESDEMAMKSVLDKIINAGEFTDRVEYLYKHPNETDRREVLLKDGRVFDRYSAPMIGRDGENYGRVWYFRDISESKKLETRLKELDALKTKFIQIVSHQLRTPLNVTRWNLEMVLSGSRGELKGAMEELVRISLDANVKVTDRIDDLLTALDIEENRLAFLRKKTTSLESLLDSVITELKPEMKVKDLRFSYTEPPESLPPVNIDPEKIRSSLKKIIGNAITYTENKGDISVLLKEENGKAIIGVSDTGIGIPKDEEGDIGTRFFRASNAAKMSPDASGLGIFIAKYFVEQHSGKITFNSEEGKGTTFFIELPLLLAPSDK